MTTILKLKNIHTNKNALDMLIKVVPSLKFHLCIDINGFELHVMELYIDIPLFYAGGGDCWVKFILFMKSFLKLMY